MHNRWLKFKLSGRDRLLERMMLDQNLKAYKSSTETYEEKQILGRETSQCKDPGAERPSIFCRSKETSMTAAVHFKRQAGGKGQRGQQGLTAQGP